MVLRLEGLGFRGLGLLIIKNPENVASSRTPYHQAPSNGGLVSQDRLRNVGKESDIRTRVCASVPLSLCLYV